MARLRPLPRFRFAATVLQSSAQQLGVTVEIEEQPFVEAITAIKSTRSNCFVPGNANLSAVGRHQFFAAHYLKGGFYNSGKFFDSAAGPGRQAADDFGRHRARQAAQAGGRYRGRFPTTSSGRRDEDRRARNPTASAATASIRPDTSTPLWEMYSK